MSVSKKLRAGLAISAVLASCQLVGCGSDTVDGGGAGESGSAGKAGSSAQAGKAGMTGHAGAGHAGEAEGGMAGEVEVGGGNETGGSAGLATAGGGSGGLANGGKGGAGGTSGGGAGGLANGGKGGSGGVSAGSGGVSAGSGGVSAGSGGASAGSGGVSAGSGGASAGTGGASAGTGGASAGTGGGATVMCGNGVVDTGEVCDPKFSVNDCGSDCKKITSAACVTCETNQCAPSVMTCDTAVGGTTTAAVTGSSGGAKPTDPNPVTTPVGSPKAPLCNEVLDCVRDSGCAANGNPALKSCYCGSVSVSNCNSGLGNGACKAQIERALETTDFATVSQRVGNTLYGGGVAMKRVDCDQSFCADPDQGCL